MDSIKTDLADQQASLSNIERNTSNLDNIAMNTENIEMNTSSIKTSSSNTATQLGTIKSDTTALTSSVGTASDASTSNTVIGLLKSIANKL